MTPRAKAWFARRFGLPPEVELSDDGSTLSVPGVAGGIQVSRDGVVTATCETDDEAALLGLLAMQINDVREAPPKVVIILADDPDYVWPPFVDQRLIRPLPFSCSRCSRRVKRARFALAEIRQCLCMSAVYAPGCESRPPRSRLEWDALRVESANKEALTRAAKAGNPELKAPL
jgi:hypothetical protein